MLENWAFKIRKYVNGIFEIRIFELAILGFVIIEIGILE